MTEGIDRTALRENPELFRIILLNTIEEITSCMSEGDSTTLRIKQEQEDLMQKQVRHLQSNFKKSVDELINNMWNQLQITDKVSFVRQLESQCSSHIIAWRPKTGEIPIRNLRGHYLTETKRRFLYKMTKCEAESEELKNTLYTKASALGKSVKKMSKAEKSLENVFTDYEKIIRDNS